MKILHIADLHLRDRDHDEAQKCLEYLTGYADLENIDLIVVAGDVFDSQDVKMESKAAGLAVKSISDLADIAPVVIVVGTPSHDGMAPIILSHVRGDHPILVADRPCQYALRRGAFCPMDASRYTDADAIISLIPQPTKQYFQTAAGIKHADQEIGDAMTAIFASCGLAATTLYPDAPHILVGHFNVRGSSLSNGQVLVGMDIEITPDQIDAARADIVCLGHIHKAQQIRSNIFYSGSIYHTNWGEMEAKGGYIHEVEHGNKPFSTFIECPAKKMMRFAFDATAVENVDITLDDYLNALAADVRQAYARFDITVWQDQAAAIDKEKLRGFFLMGGALDVDIRIIRVPRHNVRAEAVLKAERLRDKIQRMAELRGEEIEWSVLGKADSLEDSLSPDELLEAIGRAA